MVIIIDTLRKVILPNMKLADPEWVSDEIFSDEIFALKYDQTDSLQLNGMAGLALKDLIVLKGYYIFKFGDASMIGLLLWLRKTEVFNMWPNLTTFHK